MKLLVFATAIATGAVLSVPAMAQESLAKSTGCLNCHAADTKKVGPSFKDIAAKYKGKSDAEAKLVEELSKGKGHPAVKASPDDVKSLVKWVLAT